MDEIRSMSMEGRKRYYASDRVQEQREWYARKAGLNKAAARRWVFLGIAAYLTAASLVLIRIRLPAWDLWPIEPILVFASSIIGWTHIKKYNELRAAYTVTAHEIGIIKPKIERVSSEAEFSDSVNDAELAFSREHTLWIARQTS
jgi:hypothetical protein